MSSSLFIPLTGEKIVFWIFRFLPFTSVCLLLKTTASKCLFFELFILLTPHFVACVTDSKFHLSYSIGCFKIETNIVFLQCFHTLMQCLKVMLWDAWISDQHLLSNMPCTHVQSCEKTWYCGIRRKYPS